MFRKLILPILLVIALMSMSVSASPVQAQEEEESILIYPWQIPEDENGDRVVTVTSDQIVILGARWGACSKGLAQAWARTASVMYSMEGQPLFFSQKESRVYWSRPVAVEGAPIETCVNHSDTAWYVYWEYQLGNLPPGDHTARFDYWNDHLAIDGGDYDGDGKPDHFQDWSIAVDFIIRVEE